MSAARVRGGLKNAACRAHAPDACELSPCLMGLTADWGGQPWRIWVSWRTLQIAVAMPDGRLWSDLP